MGVVVCMCHYWCLCELFAVHERDFTCVLMVGWIVLNFVAWYFGVSCFYSCSYVGFG